MNVLAVPQSKTSRRTIGVLWVCASVVGGCGVPGVPRDDTSELPRLRAEPILAVPQGAVEIDRFDRPARVGGPIGNHPSATVVYASRLKAAQVFSYYNRRFGEAYDIRRNGPDPITTPYEFSGCGGRVGQIECTSAVFARLADDPEGVYGEYPERLAKAAARAPRWARTFVVVSVADSTVG